LSFRERDLLLSLDEISAAQMRALSGRFDRLSSAHASLTTALTVLDTARRDGISDATAASLLRNIAASEIRMTPEEMAASIGNVERPAFRFQRGQLDGDAISRAGVLITEDRNVGNRALGVLSLGHGALLLPYLMKKLEGKPLALACSFSNATLRKAPSAYWSVGQFVGRSVTVYGSKGIHMTDANV
jgi:hypothetical protein